MFKVYVVEDNDWYNKLLVHCISMDSDIVVESFFNGTDFLKQLHNKPDLITLDYRLPDFNGEELLDKIKEFNPDIPVIVISGQEDVATAVEMLQKGAWDYLVKSDDIKQRILNSIHKVIKTRNLEKKVAQLQVEVEKKYDFQKTIIGNCEPLKKVFSLIEKAAATNINVSILGETGTGKELVAKAIHYNSPRKAKNFVPVNLAALPIELMESELFGHEKGAFTGANETRKGRFEEANLGTLFLDEIAEIPLTVQAKLLRVLQEKEFSPVGSNKLIKTYCRLIVATHRNMQEAVKEGKFREDLYYRIFGLTLNLPPLRNRGLDILLLANSFISEFCKSNRLPLKTLSQEANKKLMSYHFPGNIRELKAIVDTAVVICEGDKIQESDIIVRDNDVFTENANQKVTLREYNYRLIKRLQTENNGNLQEVANELDISLSTIYRMLKEFEA